MGVLRVSYVKPRLVKCRQNIPGKYCPSSELFETSAYSGLARPVTLHRPHLLCVAHRLQRVPRQRLAGSYPAPDVSMLLLRSNTEM